MSTHRFDTVLLDVGGVLHLPDHELALGAAQSAGIAIDRDLIDRAHYRGCGGVVVDGVHDGTTPWQRHHDAYFERHLDCLGVDPDARPAMHDALRVAYAAAPPWGRIAPGAFDALRALADAGLQIGIVCNADGTTADRLAAQGFGAVCEFACLIDSAVVGISKPDPRIFGLAIDQLGLEPERTCFVGDMPGIDIPGARATGITPLILDPWADHPSARDYATISSLHEVV